MHNVLFLLMRLRYYFLILIPKFFTIFEFKNFTTSDGLSLSEIDILGYNDEIDDFGSPLDLVSADNQ